MVTYSSCLVAMQETHLTWDSQITSPSQTGDSQIPLRHRASSSLPFLKCTETWALLSSRDSFRLHFSLQVTSRNKHSDYFTSTRTNKPKYRPPDLSFPHRSSKLFKTIPSSTYKLCGDTDAFTPKSSLTTLLHEIRSHPPPKSQNCASSSSESVLSVSCVSYNLLKH